jgi:DMSO/TMAO reductase YedYZ molybdopterin-dependent catalytic subunit
VLGDVLLRSADLDLSLVDLTKEDFVSHSLPPGQREAKSFHRFGLNQFAERFPKETAICRLAIIGKVAHELQLSEPLKGLPKTEQISDFHCVTTWSVRQLRWEGVLFTDFYRQVIVPRALPQAGSTLVALRGQDGARTGMLLDDLLGHDVLLADRLNGEPLSIDHGAPLRLIAPAHYGYKSAKHLAQIEFRDPDEGYKVSGLRFMDHPRARVALEERGRIVPGWILRYLYLPLICGTVARFSKASLQRKSNERLVL